MDDVEGSGLEAFLPKSEHLNEETRQWLLNASRETESKWHELLNERDPDKFTPHSRIVYQGGDDLQIATRDIRGGVRSEGRRDLKIKFGENNRAELEMPMMVHKSRTVNDQPEQFKGTASHDEVLQIVKKIEQGEVFRPEWIIPVSDRKRGEWVRVNPLGE